MEEILCASLVAKKSEKSVETSHNTIIWGTNKTTRVVKVCNFSCKKFGKSDMNVTCSNLAVFCQYLR